jgi:hypothetical protein
MTHYLQIMSYFRLSRIAYSNIRKTALTLRQIVNPHDLSSNVPREISAKGLFQPTDSPLYYNVIFIVAKSTLITDDNP